MLLTTVLAAPAAADSGSAALVRTDKGLVKGEVLQDHRAFRGVPFAEPPVGELRWKAPRPAEPWPGIRDATAPGSQCAQPTTPYGGQTTPLDLAIDVFSRGRQLDAPTGGAKVRDGTGDAWTEVVGEDVAPVMRRVLSEPASL
ncbi:hypothetical protein EJK15_15080 [Nonomuraea basaltis]|nr:hypothetical protein EJK15_15080 [Nonomuraea basaltis]